MHIKILNIYKILVLCYGLKVFLFFLSDFKFLKIL